MSDQVQPLIALLSGHFGWVPAAVSWIGALRLALKCFNAGLQGKLTERMAAAAGGSDAGETRDWEAVLGARWYRVLNFSLDLVCSVKLPGLAELERLKAEKLKS